MTLAEFIPKTYLLATGKVAALSPESTKYKKLLSIANIMQQQWQNEPDIDWESTYNIFEIDGVVEAQDTYSLPVTFHSISTNSDDKIKIVIGGQTTEFERVSPDGLSNTTNAVSKIGSTIKFSTTFPTGDPLISGTIKVPGYKKLTDLVNPEDTIQVDDPNWLAYMTAAEYARNDTVKSGQYGNLVAYAAESMRQMKEANASSSLSINTDWRPAGEDW